MQKLIYENIRGEQAVFLHAPYVLCSLRGLNETIQYGQGERRFQQMQRHTAGLAADEERMKRITGRNIAITNSIILLFDLTMLLLSALLCQQGVPMRDVWEILKKRH